MPVKGKIEAIDEDAVGEILFSINSNIISVDKETREVTLIEKLDFEEGFLLI